MPPFSLSTITDWCFENMFLLVIAGMLIYFVSQYLRVSKKSKWQLIDRRKVELANAIENLKYNFNPDFKWLFKGQKRIGLILNYLKMTMPKNPIILNPEMKGKQKFEKPQKPQELKKEDMIDVIAIVFRPSFDRLPMAKPWCKLDVIYIFDDPESIDRDLHRKALIIKTKRGINRYFGIRFDMRDSEVQHKNIIYHNLLKTDSEQMGSRYYVKAQLETVFDPATARDALLEEKRLQVELAKKKGKMESL